MHRRSARQLAVYMHVLMLLSSRASAATLTLHEPSKLTQCRSVNLTWTGGVSPFALNIGRPVSSTFVASFEYYPNVTDHFFIWTTDIASGTVVALELTDSARPIGNIVTHAFDIDSGHDSCLPKTTANSSLYPSSSISSAVRPATTHSSGAQAPVGGDAASAERKPLLSPYAIVGVTLGAVVVLVATLGLLVPWLRRRCTAPSRAQHFAEMEEFEERTAVWSGSGDALWLRTHDAPDGEGHCAGEKPL
ncbi:hypothetical protein C8Q80DRAFT_442947 [Daedaleopsis nitida]|nr:hypothetical protein C8Q80DRAFT_442947 [Daedaleopsis nitida]